MEEMTPWQVLRGFLPCHLISTSPECDCSSSHWAMGFGAVCETLGAGERPQAGGPRSDPRDPQPGCSVAGEMSVGRVLSGRSLKLVGQPTELNW